ncbi:MAG TPA: glycerophosphodiester phosphodiesterase [Polyangiaceae bacterium]
MPITPFPSLPRPLLFGHRGASAKAPENTLAAFERAVAAGADVLELDVHLSKDGVVVVHHDALVDRTTNGRGEVRGFAFAELRALDAGYRFADAAGEHGFRGRGCQIPRLADVLAAFPGRGFNIELKQAEPPMVRAVLDVLERAGNADVVLAAADDGIMRAIEAAKPGVPLGMSSAECWRFWWQTMLGRPPREFAGRCLQVPPYHYGVLPVLSRRVVRAAHDAGLEVHVWTINDPREAAHWLSRGVDGVMSDDPDAIAHAVLSARRAA